MRYKKCKAIIFDLDGTLLNTLDDLADANNQALGELGFPPHPVDDYKQHVGNGVRLLLERTLPEGSRDDAMVEKGIETMIRIYGKCWDNKTRPYTGIAEMLDELTRRGVRMAILSNKPHAYTRVIVDKLLGNWKFEEVWGVNETVPPKPDPAGISSLIDKMALTPEDFVYLGDTATDMETANGANIFAIGVLWGFRTADELNRSGAKVLLSKPAELLDVLGD
jgi:phosphoglycolate phosphatase